MGAALVDTAEHAASLPRNRMNGTVRGEQLGIVKDLTAERCGTEAKGIVGGEAKFDVAAVVFQVNKCRWE